MHPPRDLRPQGYGIVDVLAHLNIGQRLRLMPGVQRDRQDLHSLGRYRRIGNDAPARFTQPGFNAGLTFRIEL